MAARAAWITVVCMLALSIVTAAPGSAARPRPKATPRAEVPTRDIAIVINGETLPADPAPRVVGSRLLVPVVRIYSALGIDVARSGNDVTATAPTKRIVVHVGRSQATIDGKPVDMGGAAVDIGGTTYVPLRFVSESIGAQVSYEAKAARVEIVSPLIGRVQGMQRAGPGGAITVSGEITALDVNSVPATVTVTRGPSVRTISINSSAKIVVQDTVARTSVPAALADLRVGDSIAVSLNRNGSVAQIVAFYASHSGTAAAVSASAVVLGNGRVITPDRSTEITLNGAPAQLSELQVGDAITVRSNPETGEKRQIIASRAIPQTPGPPAAVKIDAFSISAKGALRAGDSFDLTLKGTPRGRASFDIGLFLTDLPLRETSPGTYTGHYTIPTGVNFSQATIYGHLTVNGTGAPRVQAQEAVSASTTPPQITNVAPRDGLVVNNARPSIFATFDSPSDVGINASSVQIRVNNLDVTASSTRTTSFITYSPSVALADGTVDVQVKVSDMAGNVATRHWTFTIKSK